MKRILFACAFLAVFLSVLAQKEEARYNYINKTITRNADGSTDLNVSFSLTFYTYNATNYTYGETYVIYNPDFQTLKINEAYTVQKNGKKVPLPERAVTDVLPSWAAKAADFNHLKEKVIIHTGLELGCTVYLDYTVHSAPGFNKNFDFNEQFDQTSPITKLKYTVNVPANADLKVQMYSPDGKIEPKSNAVNGGQRSVEYVVDSIPARSKDTYQRNDLTRHYNFFCTTSDFKTELQDMFYSDIDPAIRAWADDLVRNEPDGKKRYDLIHDYVRDGFTTVNIPLSVADGIRPMAKVRHGAYITPYEKAALLNQMLRACNIQSDVCVAFDKSLPQEFRTMNNVQKFYVTHRLGEEEKILDPAENLKVVTPETLVGLGVEKIKPHKGKVVFKKHELSVTPADLTDEGYCILTLPENRDGLAGWGMTMLPSLREVDFEIPHIIDECDIYTITVDPSLKMAGDYSTTLADGATGVKMTETKEVTEDGKIVLKRFVLLSKKIYTVEEYETVRNIIMNWMSASRRRVLFVKK